MRFHDYGPVQVAIVRGTGDDHEATFARLDGSTTVYELRETGEVTIDELAGPQPEEAWFTAFIGGERARLSSRADEHIAALLDAGSTLCWHEYERFQAADRAMGDPNP